MTADGSSEQRHVVTNATITYTGAQFLCEALSQAGVTHVFGGHGGAVVPLIDAIVAHPKLTWVYARCETNASQMAAADAKLRGSLGCCVATSGPGASHLLSGLIDADQDRCPVLCITGMKDLGHTRHADFQDIDQASIFRMAGLALSETVASIGQLLPLTRNAFTAALSANRCAHIAIPIDVQMQTLDARSDFCLGTSFLHQACVPASRVRVETLATALKREIESDRRVIIACGYRANKVGALVERFAELLHAPILTSYDGKGTVDEHHPLAYGVVGVYGNVGTSSATDLLDQCQTVIGICVNEWSELILDKSGLQVRRFVQIDERLIAGDSMRFDPTATFSCGFLSESLHRVIDVLEEDLSHSARLSNRVTMTSAGMLKKGLAKRATVAIPQGTYEATSGDGIWAKLKQGSHDKPFGTPSTLTTGRRFTTHQNLSDTKHCHPALFFRVMSDHLDEKTVVCADIGDNALFMASALIAQRGQRFLTSEHLGIMGYSVNSGLAASMSSKGKKLVVAGDGGVQMSINELSTFKDHGASNVLVVVIKNSRLGRVQNEAWGPGLKADGCAIGAPNFVELFKAYGYPDGMVLSTCETEVIESTIEKGWAAAEKNGCCIIEVMQDPATHPIMHKLQYRASLHAKPYSRTRSADSTLPKIKVEHWVNDKPQVQQWLNALTEVTSSDPYWLEKGDLLLQEPARLIEKLLPSLGGIPVNELFHSHEARVNFNIAYDAAVLNTVSARELLEEVVSRGQSNGHPLKFQLIACPPKYISKLHSHPSVQLTLPLVGSLSEKYLTGATLDPSLLAGHSPMTVAEVNGKFYEPPKDEEIASQKKSIEEEIENKILSLGESGRFLSRLHEEGHGIYYQVGSVNQSYTEDTGCLMFVLWSGINADMDIGVSLGIEGNECLMMA